MTLAEMLKRLRERQQKSKKHCIFTAYDYMRTLEECSSDHEQFKNMLELRKSADWQNLLTKSKESLTYKNEDMGVIGGVKNDDTNNIINFGTPKRQNVQMKRGAIMEIECVLTSKNKDRDGDTLEPEGAILDEKMPFLWQHIPVQPIGVFTGLVHRDVNQVMVSYSIIDNLLGRDAAQLIEFGALRISHGFRPEVFKWVEEEPDNNGMCFGGFHVEKYEVMEGSAVSIPANKDAVITAFSKHKLHHPLVKLWAGNLNENRTKTYDTNGFDPKTFQPTINVNVSLGDVLNTNKGNPKTKKEDEPPVDDKPKDDKPVDDAKTNEPEPDNKTKSVMLGDIIDGLNEIATMESVPSEAANRCTVVLGMLEEVGQVLEHHSEIFADSMANQDLSNMLTSIADVINGIVDNLQKVCNEIQTIRGIEGMPDAAGNKLGEIAEQVASVQEAISAMMAATQTDDNNTTDAGINPDVVGAPIPTDNMTSTTGTNKNTTYAVVPSATNTPIHFCDTFQEAEKWIEQNQDRQESRLSVYEYDNSRRQLGRQLTSTEAESKATDLIADILQGRKISLETAKLLATILRKRWTSYVVLDNSGNIMKNAKSIVEAQEYIKSRLPDSKGWTIHYYDGEEGEIGPAI